jgi:hypothetical protein
VQQPPALSSPTTRPVTCDAIDSSILPSQAPPKLQQKQQLQPAVVVTRHDTPLPATKHQTSSNGPVSGITQPVVRGNIQHQVPFLPASVFTKPNDKNLAKAVEDKQDGSEYKHKLFAQSTPQAKQFSNINKVQPRQTSEQNPKINDLVSLMNSRMAQKILKEEVTSSAQSGTIDLGRRPQSREVFCHFCQRIRLHIHHCSFAGTNVYIDSHNKLIVCDDNIRKLDCMDPVDIVDHHGPTLSPAKPAVLLTGDTWGDRNSTSDFHSGQKLMAEYFHTAMNQHREKANEPVKTPPALQYETNEPVKTPPALQNAMPPSPDKYPMPPDLMKELKLTEEETYLYKTHGYCILRKTREENMLWDPTDWRIRGINRQVPARKTRKAEGNDNTHVRSWVPKSTMEGSWHTTIWDKRLSWEDIQKKEAEKGRVGNWSPGEVWCHPNRDKRFFDLNSNPPQ